MAEELATQFPASPKLKALRDTFHYYAPFYVMICRPCQCAVFDAQVNRHLRLHHKSPDKAQFLPREVLSYFQNFPERIRSAQDLVLPTEPISAVPFLSVHQDTFQCCELPCRWIGRSLHRIQEHYRLQHGWKAPHVSERSTAVAPWTPILSQQLIPRGPGSQRFAVFQSISDEDLPPRSPAPPSNRPSQPGATPTEVPSSPSVVSSLSPASPGLEDSTTRPLRTPRSQSHAQPRTPAPAPLAQAALNGTDAPRLSRESIGNDGEPSIRVPGPSNRPRKRLRASKAPSLRSLSSAPGHSGTGYDQRRSRAFPAPTQIHTRPSQEPHAQRSATPAPPESPLPRPHSSPIQLARLVPPDDLLTRALEDWARECPLCRAEGLVPSARTHPLTSCEGANAELVRQESTQLLQHISVRSESCRGCGLPRSFCNKFKNRSGCAQLLSHGRTCYAPQVMAPTIISIGIFDTPRFELVLGSIEGGDTVDMEDSEKVYQWFAQETPLLGMTATRLTQVFYLLYYTTGHTVNSG